MSKLKWVALAILLFLIITVLLYLTSQVEVTTTDYWGDLYTLYLNGELSLNEYLSYLWTAPQSIYDYFYDLLGLPATD